MGYLQEKKMEMSRNECQDLKASCESRAKHGEALQSLPTLLRDTEERLQATQEETRELLRKLQELGEQAEGARVCGGGTVRPRVVSFASRVRAVRALREQQRVEWVRWPSERMAGR